MVNDERLDEILSEYSPGHHSRQSRPLDNLAYSTALVKLSSSDPYVGIPGASRRMRDSQRSLTEFVEANFGPVELLADKAKGIVATILGRSHTPITMDVYLERQLGFMQEVISDLEYVLDLSTDVESEMIEHLKKKARARGSHTGELLEVEQKMASISTNKEYLQSALSDMSLADPKYSTVYEAVLEADRQYAVLQRRMVKAGTGLVFEDRSLPVINGALITLQQGMLHAQKSHSEFENTTELIREMLPYIRLIHEYGADRSEALYMAKNLTSATLHAMGLSEKAMGAFSNLGPGAAFYSEMPLEMAAKLQSIGLAAKRGSSSMMSNLQDNIDSISSRKGI